MGVRRHTIVRVGLIILFVGLSLLARYAASAGLFPIEMRLALVVAVGIALLAVGIHTRESHPGFGLAPQGGRIATIYLTVLAAAKLYAMFPIMTAFVLMIVVCALASALALLQRSQTLAITAFAGSFAVPLLLAAGGGTIAVVFIYRTILNLTILFIAQRQAWRVLNLVGFSATFGMAPLRGTTRYQPTDFVAAQGFLIASVLIYVATAGRRRSIAARWSTRPCSSVRRWRASDCRSGWSTSLRERVRRDRFCCALAGHRRLIDAVSLRHVPRYQRDDAGDRYRLRHAGGAAGARRTLDVGRVGARRYSCILGRHARGGLNAAAVRHPAPTRGGADLPRRAVRHHLRNLASPARC